MPDSLTPEAVIPVNPISIQLAEESARASAGRAEVLRDDSRGWLALEEATSEIAFAEAEGDLIHIVPFIGDAAAVQSRSYFVSLGPSFVDGEQELIVNSASLAEQTDQDEVLGYLSLALDYWSKSTDSPDPDSTPPAASSLDDSVPTLGDVDFAQTQSDRSAAEESRAEATGVVAQVRADISGQWSWASSSARIPQISALTVELADSVEHVRIKVSVTDADITFGTATAFEGSLPAGNSHLGSVHVPLSARVMSQVEERHGAECTITFEDAESGRALTRIDEAIDIQPRDLWLWGGDPRRSEQRARKQRRSEELAARLQADPDHPDAAAIRIELATLDDQIQRDSHGAAALARSLLASFVRPNHPEIAIVARETADQLGRATGDSSFFAFQADVATAERRADETVTAIYEALQARAISYSDPPPGWDYYNDGQRIRDHGEVARGGLGTCMDTTVLTAAVIEQVGLLPVLVLVPGHIFVGYWRRNPVPEHGVKPEWYPDTPFLSDVDKVVALVDGGFLGVIETTAFAVGVGSSATKARSAARNDGLENGLNKRNVGLIDVVAARQAGVSPLPAVNERADGVTEIIEYRPGGDSKVTEVELGLLDDTVRARQVDNHPARYRTWKSSLFSLNATNPLLNLGNNARVQPLVLPSEGLGRLEDKLNQDVSFSLHSGYDIPEVWQARDIRNAIQLLGTGKPEDRDQLIGHMNERRLYIQRLGRSRGQMTALTPPTFVKEIRSIAHNAKTAHDERGMNPLFLCLGMLRWPYKSGVFAAAPLILVPVNISVARGRQDFILSLDGSQQTTPNAALIEWLRREHGLSISGLAEPLADRAGIDVDGVLAEVRNAIAQRGLMLEVVAEARIATLDLSAFRMWQDLNLNADGFMKRPLIRHLVETPTEQFEDPAIEAAGEAATDVSEIEAIEKIDTPVPADSTQKRAVQWASQGRTFVLQGPPGTGKSQTITNMVSECVMAGMRVLFVAEKGTALAVVQRRLDAIGLGPFTLNLHHEGSNATEVRAQLKRALTASVTPDRAAMESARRRLRTARFELMQYPQHLHEPNAAGLSAYAAHDELLVLGDGPTMAVPPQVVAHQAEQIEVLRQLFENIQQWTAAAGVRPNHPWRLAGVGADASFNLEVVGAAVTGVLDGNAWALTTTGALRGALDDITDPSQLKGLAAAANSALPSGDDLAGVLSAHWPTTASEKVSECERSVEGWTTALHGFSPDVLRMDLRAIAGQLQEADSSGVFGRGKRQTAALSPLTAVAPPNIDLQPSSAPQIVKDLIAVQDVGSSVRSALTAVPGLGVAVPDNPFLPGALQPVRDRLEELLDATAGLRSGGQWIERVHALAQAGDLSRSRDDLTSYSNSWQGLWASLAINEADFQVWRGDRTLLEATAAVSETWRRDVNFERLLPLQNWCTLVRKLEPLREAGLDSVRAEILEGSLPSYVAEDALTRGVAQASLKERISASGLDRFSSVAHDQRVASYSEAQAEVRTQWASDGPATLLERRGGGGSGKHTGGLARELEKTTRRLGTRPILRKYGEAVQELTPLVLCSPSSVVDLIEPGVMEFDVVIFDEASQITVPEAVGALGRARAAIVVGDTKQMPPTRKVGGGVADEADIDDPDAEEIIEDQESILSECELARVPTLSLNWHYRSQDEALIAFSNRAYYRGDLSSFPTPTLLSSATGVIFRRVDGQYLRAGSAKVEVGTGIVAGSNTNPAEAFEIVKFIEELVNESDKLPSVGIVTFNEQQRQLIEDLLHASRDHRVADVMDESKMGRGEALFVKALEQVQGDERDNIIFSIAFSKQANGKIPTNFGPLSTSGGERRLNVAITRARRRNVVFCSFDPSELDVSGSTYNGPKDLKDFLSFAKSSGSSQAPGEVANRAAIRDRHRDDIADALRLAGLHVIADVGLSNFRLDLVLARQDNPTRPILPILLDGESWRKRVTVSDRDVLPVEVLENLMGWPAVARIWWPMWLQNRQEVIDRILAEVDSAEAQLDRESQVSAAVTREPSLSPPTDPVVAPELSPPPTDPDTAERTSTLETGPSASSATETLPDTPVQEEIEQHLPSALEQPASTGSPQVTNADTEVEIVEGVEDDSVGVTSESAPQLTSTPSTDEQPIERDPDEASEFVPAHTNVVGTKDVLDELPSRSAAAIVREQVLDVIETEGPIEIARLSRIVARRFGLNAVREARQKEITKLIPRAQRRKSRLGSFAWPTGLDPETWVGFRYVDGGASRALDEVAPEEIENAMLEVLADDPEASPEDVLRDTAELFGILRLGANVRSRLSSVYRKLPSEAFDPPADPEASPPSPDVVVNEAPVPQAAATPQPSEEPGVRVVAPNVPTVRSPDPIIDSLSQDADAVRPDFSNVGVEFYYDYTGERPLGPDLRTLVNELVLDPDFDGSRDGAVAKAGNAGVSIEDLEAVGYSAVMVWSETFGKSLDHTARELVTHLAADPEFEPLPWDGHIEGFVADRMAGKRPGLVALVQLQLNQYALDSGLIAKLEEQFKREAHTALDAMTPIDRDIFGFTSRNAKRLQIAEPYITHVKDSHRRYVIYWMAKFEGEETGLAREARYATAVRALTARGESRAAISRTLGISTSVMDRIQRENRRDVVLASSDPILTDLAPAID